MCRNRGREMRGLLRKFPYSERIRPVWTAGISWAALMLVSGCTPSVQPELEADPRDPYETQNRASFEFNMGLDDYVLEPTAEVYRDAVPSPVQRSVSNYLEWTSLPKTAVNSAAQGKAENASLAVFRFAINALSFGTADLMEGEDRPQPEDFGQTLASYNVPQGAYIVVPVLGSHTSRSLSGWIVDSVIDPFNSFNNPNRNTVRTVSIPTGAVSYRADYFDVVNDVKYNSLDPYSRVRSAYFQQRDGLLVDNGLIMDEQDDDFDSFFEN